jgi:hypothetical protein
MAFSLTLELPDQEQPETPAAPPPERRAALWRSRWAAIGAAVAVALGGGGLLVANAASSAPSAMVMIDPVRVLDTRDPLNVGLAGPFVSQVPQKLQITGSVPTTPGGPQVVVPTGATGVLLNVTAVAPSRRGFVGVRPGDATGLPATSSINVEQGQVVPNAVTVALPTAGPNAGRIDITFDAYGVAGATTDMIIDVVGYTTAGGGAAYPSPNPDTTIVSMGPANTDQVLTGVSLPAGRYVVTASVIVNNNAAVEADVACRLRLGGSVLSSTYDYAGPLFPLAPNGTAGERESLSFVGAGTLASPGTADLQCRSTVASGNYLSPSVTAIQVATITTGNATALTSQQSSE